MKEIERLKAMLEGADIPFEYDENGDICFSAQLCYPENTVEKRVCSVIQNCYSYGGEENLLEIAGLLTDEEKETDEVAGWLSAEQVFNRIKRHWELKGSTART